MIVKRKALKNNKAVTALDPDEIFIDSLNVPGYHLLPEGKIERPIGRVYSLVLVLLIGLGLSYLSFKAYSLAVLSGDVLFAKSQENRFTVQTVFPPRGMIYDSNDKPMVENVSSFGLVFEKEKLLKGNGDLRILLTELGKLLDRPPEFFFALGFPEDHRLENIPARIFIIKDLPLEKLVSISSRLESLTGVSLFESYRRVYKDPFAFSHLLGFVGKISDQDISARPDLQGEETIGKNGLEAFYDESLRGHVGKKIAEVDSLGRETRFKYTEEPKEGLSLRLEVDGDLQKKAYETLHTFTGGKKGGSIVMLDPRSGEIRALVSFPGYDSNSFGYALSQNEFKEVLRDPLKPLFNRAIGGEFPSGSIIKPLIAAAALEEKIIDPQKKIYDPGFIEIPNPYKPGEKSVFSDWRPQGWVNMQDAIAFSANVYFYIIGGGYQDQDGLGITKIKKYANAFGLGSVLGIDLPGEKSGFIPDPDTKIKIDSKDPVWRLGDTYNVSIGQGGVGVTPLQMASVTAALANGGTLYKPMIVSSVLDEYGQKIKKNRPKIIRENLISKDNLEKVKKGMRQTVVSGTARSLADLPVPAAAKTGTAQIGKNQLPHAWVTIFAPMENPQIAMAVMVESAGEGSAVAVPIAKEILQWYFSRK